MTTPAVIFFALAAGAALVDWWAVTTARKRVEYVLKPAVMLLLIAAALALHPQSAPQREWFVAALLFGLAGDVFLMLPQDRFIAGLVAFLLGHLAFIGGFAVTGLSAFRGVSALALVGAVAAVLAPRVLAGVRARGKPQLVPAVVAYMLVISLMVAAAAASRQPLAVLPAALFFGSDTLIAFNRFVSRRPWMPVAIMVTYHLAQAGLVAWLATG